MAARIDDNDPEFPDDYWTCASGGGNDKVSYPLRADRWWSSPGMLEGDHGDGRCMGIECNIWARARKRREITHSLRGGGGGKLLDGEQ